MGNPSDGYGGRVLAATVAQLSCRATAVAASQWEVRGLDGAVHRAATVDELGALVADGRLAEGAELVAAAVVRGATARPDLVADPAAVSVQTSIPRQVGLSGSSAVVIATLRSLANLRGASWDALALARTALEAETVTLGLTAGPQDRVVQAYGGLLDMRFAEPWAAASHEPLDPDVLPSFYVAWACDAGASSDVVHTDVRARWDDGDPEVIAAMARFADLAAEARTALDERRPDDLVDLCDAAFSLRRSIWHITDVDRQLVDLGRSLGAGVTLAGSGGAVVGVVPRGTDLAVVEQAHRDLDVGFLVPVVGPSHGAPA